MRVLLLTWAGGRGPTGAAVLASATAPTQARGLAAALDAAGHDVRVVTRAHPQRPTDPAEVETHVVADAPPIVPSALADPVLDALAFANRATSVAVRRLEEAPVDVVHAEGWQTGPVVAALQHSHEVPVVAVVEPWELASAHPAIADVAGALAATADVRVQRAPRPTGPGVLHLPPGVTLSARRPGPPPVRGPLVLVAPPGVAHRDLAGRVRRALASPRRISRSWARRPFAVAVLDPHDLDSVVRGLALGVPVVAVPGPTGDLVTAAAAGDVLPADVATSSAVDGLAGGAPARRAAEQLAVGVAGAVDRMAADRRRTAALGADATAAAARHDWSSVADTWATAVTRAVRRGGRPRARPRLHAAD